MGTDRNRKRLEKIEGSLTPREIVALWVEELAKFNSIDDYVRVDEPKTRAERRLPECYQQIENGIAGHPDGRGKNSPKTYAGSFYGSGQAKWCSLSSALRSERACS